MILHKDEVKDKYIKSWIISILVLLNIIAFVLLGNQIFLRIDMTSDKSYSVSIPTVELLNKIDPKTPMTIEYYYLDKCTEFAWMKQIVQYIIDMLKEYESVSKGSINVVIKSLNYEKNRAEIDRLERLGFQSFQLRESQESEQKIFLGYSGIIIKYKNKQIVIPIIVQDIGFEYLLDIQIKKLVNPSMSKIGLIFSAGSYPFNSLKDNYSNLQHFLNQDFSGVKLINKGEKIPDDIETIVIIGGTNLTENDIFQIDQFLLTGGRAFIALNGINLFLSEKEIKAEQNDSKLIELLKHYGITVNKNLIGDNDYFTPVTQGEGILAKQMRYPLWPRIKKENFNSKHPVVKNLSKLNLFWPSSIEIDENTKENVEILFKTTKNSLVQTTKFKLQPENFKEELVVKGTKERIIGIAFDGKVKSFFTNKDISKFFASDIKRRFVKEANIKFILVSNELFLANNFMQDEERNFFLNAIDWLSDENSLIEIRNKGKFSRPLDKGDKQTRNFRREFVIIFNTFIIPLIILIIGLIINIYRIIENKKIREKFKKNKEA